jgi:predicted secreted hydrolase
MSFLRLPTLPTLALPFALASCAEHEAPLAAKLAVGEALSGAADPRFERAREVREFEFPADHGPQPEFQTEWWYFTANLRDDAGREFGGQLTFFRRATGFEAPPLDSDWAARDLYMAHFALSDVQTGEFHAFERFERGALGLAGAELGPPWRVWNRDWSAQGSLEAGGAVKLRAHSGDVALELEVRTLTPPVLNGERGLSRKGASDGAASYYYSLPRLATTGTLTLGGREHRVTGSTWFDREWSTSALDDGQVGWDWFALRLGEAGEVMLYSLRRADGRPDAASSGTWIGPAGGAEHLAREDFELAALASWTSPRTGVTYPSKWRVSVPSRAAELEVEPLLAGQELDLAIRYWEGAVRVRGTVAGQGVDGRGYVELAGYER